MSTASVAAPSPPSLRLPFPLMVTAFCLLWSSAYAVAKVAMMDCPPLLVLTIRFFLAGLLMVAAAAMSGVPLRLSRRDLLLFAALGIANQAVFLGVGYLGLRSIS